MALDKPSPSVPPSVNYGRFGAAFDLIDFVRTALDSKASLDQVNLKADIGEFRTVQSQLSGAIDTLSFVRAALDSKASNDQVNQKADLGEFILIHDLAHNTANLLAFVRSALDSKASVDQVNQKADLAEFNNARNLLNDAINLLAFIRPALDTKASIDQVNSKADLGQFRALQADNKNKAYQADTDILYAANGERKREIQDLSAQDDAFSLRFSAVEQAALTLAALVAQVIAGGDQARPGDNPLAFTVAVQAGPVGAIPALPASLIATGDTGLVARLVGAGMVVTRRRTALVRNHVYRARYVLQRNADPTDPAGDAVDCAIAYFDNRGALIGAPVALVRLPTLRSADGAREVTWRIGRDAGPRVDQPIAPGSARYAVVFVRTYGADGQTDIDTLELKDITDDGARS